MDTILQIENINLSSRLFMGTAGYPSPDILRQAIEAGNPGLITVSLRRENASGNGQKFWSILKNLNIPILPNTAGCSGVQEALTTAQMARELFETNWIKLEVIGDDYSLQPDPILLLETAQRLLREGFTVFPYMTEDLVIAQRLASMGCKILMPWGAPIGSGRGLNNPYALQQLRSRFKEKLLVIDAGLGAPSHASTAMEMGYDAVLLNTAIAKSADPIKMARAFSLAVRAGRDGYLAGIITPQEKAIASTPLIDKPFWHQEN